MLRTFFITLVLLLALFVPASVGKVEFPSDLNVAAVTANDFSMFHARFVEHDGAEFFQLTHALVAPGQVITQDPPQEFKITDVYVESNFVSFIANFERGTLHIVIEGVVADNKRIAGHIVANDPGKGQHAELLMYGKIGTVDEMVKAEPELEEFYHTLLDNKEHAGQVLIDKFLKQEPK